MCSQEVPRTRDTIAQTYVAIFPTGITEFAEEAIFSGGSKHKFLHLELITSRLFDLLQAHGLSGEFLADRTTQIDVARSMLSQWSVTIWDQVSGLTPHSRPC